MTDDSNNFLEFPELSVEAVFCQARSGSSNPLLGSANNAGLALSLSFSLLALAGFYPNPFFFLTLLFTSCGLITASAITLAHNSILGSTICSKTIKSFMEAAATFSNESLNWKIPCEAGKNEAGSSLSAYVCSFAKASSLPSSEQLDAGLTIVIASGVLTFLCATVFSPSFKSRSSFWQTISSGVGLISLAIISFSMSSRMTSLFMSLVSVISGRSHTLSEEASLFVEDSLQFLVRYVFRADFASVLASLSLFSRIVLPASWLVSDGTNALSGPVVLFVATFSVILFFWRFSIAVLHGSFIADPLATLGLGTQKSFALILVQYLTGLPAHSPLLLPLFYIFDADVTWKALDKRRKLWMSGGSYYSSKVKQRSTTSLLTSPLYRARLSYLGVSAVFALCIAASFWGVSLILFGDIGGSGLHGLRLSIPGTLSSPQSRMFSKWAGSSSLGDPASFPVCQNVTDLVEGWGIPQGDDLDSSHGNVYRGAAISVGEKVSLWLQATADAAADLVVVSLGGRTEQCRMSKVTPAGVIACGALRGVLAISRIALLFATGSAGVAIKLIELILFNILPLFSRLTRVSIFFSQLPSLSPSRLSTLGKLIHESESNLFRTLPVHLAALDDHSLFPIGILRVLLLLAGVHLVFRGAPTEGLQRTIRKIIAPLMWNREDGAARTARRIREQKEAYSNDSTNTLQDVSLAIPALSAAFASIALVGFTAGAVLVGGQDLFPLDAFDLVHIPRQLSGVIIILFVVSCTLPRHISTEIIRAPIALSHSVVGSLFIAAAFVGLTNDKASTYAMFDQTWQLCVRVGLSKESSFVVNVLFIVLVFVGIFHKTRSWLNLVEPAVKTSADDADEDEDVEVERAVQRARINTSSAQMRADAIDLTDPVPPSSTPSVPARVSTSVATSSARRGSINIAPSRPTPPSIQEARVNETAPAAVSVASVVEGVANLARKMALEHERKLAEQERERKVAEILRKAEEEIDATNAAAAAVVLGGGSAGQMQASPLSFSAIQRQRRGSDAFLTSKAAAAATNDEAVRYSVQHNLGSWANNGET